VIRYVILYLCITSLLPPLLGQNRRGGGGEIPSKGPANTGSYRPPRDTSPILYYSAEYPDEIQIMADTGLNTGFLQYEPTRTQPFNHLNLGNPGSAHYPFVYRSPEIRGFRIGFNQYDLYKTGAQNAKFYQITEPFSEVAYYIGGNQADGFVTGKFSRNFAKEVNFSLDYHRMSQLGRTNQFPHQNTRNTTLTTGLKWIGLQGRYKGYFVYATNIVQSEDNGGISNPPNQDLEFFSPNSATVFLENAQTKHSHNDLFYTHFYQLKNGRFEIAHISGLKNSKYSFTDPTPYPEYYGLFDRGDNALTINLEHKQWENHFKLKTLTKGKDYLEAGLLHINHALLIDDRDSSIQNLFLTSRLKFSPTPGINLNAYAHLGLWEQAGDYEVKGNLSFISKKLGSISLGITSKLYSPAFTENYLQVTQLNAWTNDFSKTLENTIEGTLSPGKTGILLTGRYTLFNQYIYFNEQAFPVQFGQPFSLFQIELIKHFKKGSFHLENMLAFQESTQSEIFRFPRWYGQHSLYYMNRWFKVLEVRFGFDLRHHPAYFANYYHPLTGRFIVQNTRLVHYYPAVDGYFSLRVSRFRAFAQWYNLSSMFIKNNWLEHSPTYLHPDGLRFGVRWRLVN
jgi:hypothetical protein